MESLPFEFPDLRALSAGLTSVLSSHGYTEGQIVILAREPNVYASTFPSEIVTCRLDHGSELRLFCKYGVGQSQSGRGHRGGVSYEAAVYQHVLQPSRASGPMLYGVHEDAATGETWLVLEYLDKGVWIDKDPGEPRSMHLALRWLGQFHASNEARLTSTPLPFLRRYDADYYLGWARRTYLLAGQWHHRFEWLAPLCRRYEEFITPLLASPPTVIHGECYPHNILFRGGAVYPVDWESAAVAAGEIDLASLAEGWPAEIVQQYEVEYEQARWPEGAPSHFKRALDAARLHWQFRWLGDRPEWTADENCLWRFEQLHSAGEQLGLI